jgi:hypothetical protein
MPFEARLCSVGTIGVVACGAGMQCVTKPTAPFATSGCIYQAGTAACPPGFTQRTVYYADAGDSRGCSACTCGAAAGGSCSALNIDRFDALNCATATTSATDTACHNVHTSVKLTSTVVDAGACAPNGGGQPTGSYQPTDPTVICCP